MSRPKLINLMEHYHEYFHLACGFTALLIYISFVPLRPINGLLVMVIGTYLPDIDHLFFSLFYGRHTPYGQQTRQLILSGKIGEYIEYGRKHHKGNTSIISHNLLTILIFLTLSLLLPKGLLSLFFFVAVFHYLFDMVEDLIALGRLNSNWYLKFARS